MPVLRKQQPDARSQPGSKSSARAAFGLHSLSDDLKTRSVGHGDGRRDYHPLFCCAAYQVVCEGAFNLQAYRSSANQRLSVPRLHLGRAFEKDSGMVYGLAHENRACNGRTRNGSGKEKAVGGTRTSFGQRYSAHSNLIWQASRRSQHTSFDGENRERARQCDG